MSVAAVVLAAGGSTRFHDGAKLAALFRGRPLVTWAVEAALDAGLDETIVVTGAADLTLPDGVNEIRNDEWTNGLASSLACAIDACGRHDAIVVALGDMPFITPQSWRSLALSSSPIAVATYEGRRSHPVRIARELWPLIPRSGDEGARELIRRRPDLVHEVPCVGRAVDIDTVDDLNAWTDDVPDPRP
jgi:molybdenum cofactor cytidylyltransferase